MFRTLRTPLVLLLLSTASAQPAVPPAPARGTYFRHDDPPFALWIPAYLMAEKTASGSQVIASFHGTGSARVRVQIYWYAMNSVQDFLPGIRPDLDKHYPGHDTHAIPFESDCPFETVVYRTTGMQAEAVLRGMGAFRVAIQLARHCVVSLVWYYELELEDEALRDLRWVLGTFRAGGPTGLDPWLQNRCWHPATGLSFRPPRGFVVTPPAQEPGVLYAAASAPSKMALSVCRAEGLALHVILKEERGWGRRDGDTWKSANDANAGTLAAFFVDEAAGKGTAVVVVGFAEDRFFLFTVEGPIPARENLIRTAELVAMSAEFIDAAAAERAVATAAAALDNARRKRRPADMTEPLAVLVRYPFLPEAAVAMAGALTVLEDPELAARVATALADSANPAGTPDLLKALRTFESRRQNSVVAALLRALGTARDKRAVTALLHHAEHPDIDVARAAIQALGRNGDLDREGVVRRLVRLMETSDSARLRTGGEFERRFAALQPVFLETLTTLTGQAVTSLEDARGLLRQK
ncbi:MAG: HEAT repeat domain-containing protein [Planctomycetes bacterium]|nr:HEAT repeat domain-containing protein [Planctomycetota bacterium]